MDGQACWGRALLFYPWLIEAECGARLVFFEYARALRQAGLRLDCFAPSRSGEVPGRGDQLFDRLFTPSAGPRQQRLLASPETFKNPACCALVSPEQQQMALTAAAVGASGGYDVVAVSYTRYAPIRTYLPDSVRTILFTYDLDSVVAVQEERLLGTRAAFELADEVDLMQDFDLITTVGPDDASRLASAAPYLPVVEAPYCPSIEPRARPQRADADRLLIVSASAPFLDLSFAWFCERVWPLIRERRPDVKLTVAGRISETARALGLGADVAVDIKGLVDDLEPLYDAADVFIAPYLYGDGVKTKVIESLARGLPVATTPLGLSNLRIVAGEHLLVETEAEAYAAAVAGLLASQPLRERLSRAGAGYLRRAHGASACREALVRRVRAWAGERPVRVRDVAALLRRLVPRTIARCSAAGVRRVAIFGAGSHSALLLPLWRGLGGPTVAGFVVSGTPQEAMSLDLPVCSLAALEPGAVDAIVLSSETYEVEMAAACRAIWPDLPCYGIWSPTPPLSTPRSKSSWVACAV
ncbi:MAG TPA: glycosyltransferase [Vicinamibacterales bacterium]|nr:glycosyltransferase [Vicinamibacterales bacterium]